MGRTIKENVITFLNFCVAELEDRKFVDTNQVLSALKKEGFVRKYQAHTEKHIRNDSDSYLRGIAEKVFNRLSKKKKV